MTQASEYDTFAEAYSATNETSIENALYERPAMLELLGDVAGRRILDVGCGSGPLLQAMTDAFTGNGFRIAVVREPLPLPAACSVDASVYRALTVSPSFLFFVLERA